MKKNISRSEALDILASMPLESPGRSELISIVGYDPNEKWAGSLGEHSFVISEMMRKKDIEPKLQFPGRERLSVRDKITSRLDAVEAGLREGWHLAGVEGRSEMTALLGSVAKFYSVMYDGERDFVTSARMAIEEGLLWT